MVLILLGLVMFSVLAGNNLSSYVKENLVVTVMLDQDMTNPEAQQMCRRLETRPYINNIHYVSKEEALKEDLGTDPREFAGVNPFLSSIEVTLKAQYANNDSLTWISSELKNYPKVGEINYQRDLIEKVNQNLAKISVVLLVLAILLTFISFSLISNTVRLGIYARRFSIHTMKLVGASWGFIRRPFVNRAITIGMIAALFAIVFLAGCVYLLYLNEPDILGFVTWMDMAITAVSIMLFGYNSYLCSYLCQQILENEGWRFVQDLRLHYLEFKSFI